LKTDKNGSPTGIVDRNDRLLEKQAKDPGRARGGRRPFGTPLSIVRIELSEGE